MALRIGVFPASGALGTSIVNHLAKLVSVSQLVLIARNPDKWSNLGQGGATLRSADYDQPATLDNVFDGVDVLMLISYASFEIEHRVNVRISFLYRRAILTISGASHGDSSCDEKWCETYLLLVPGICW
jgi:putative NADH-flavin reductase